MAKKNKTFAKRGDLVPKGGGSPSKAAIYKYISQYTQEAIEVIVELMRTSRNPSIRLGAANKIIDKSIADLKAIQMSGDENAPIIIRFIHERDYQPTNQKLPETTSDI